MGSEISVVNINGTSSDKCKCKCGSWIRHWIVNSGHRLPKTCSVAGCCGEARVGAHVRIVWRIPLTETYSIPTPGVYILPFCSSHNNMRHHYIFGIKRGMTPIKAHECIYR